MKENFENRQKKEQWTMETEITNIEQYDEYFNILLKTRHYVIYF